ncbi:MAG: hypothetical protein LUQ31_03125 [Methanoregula sp.]|nr:hypothetical protein [Methanoregula sp.]
MKLLMGFVVLLVALVAVTGCTQTGSSSAQTTTETTVPTTQVTTAVTTTVITTISTTVPATTETIVANVTAPATNETAVTTTTAVANVTQTVASVSGVTLIHVTSTSVSPQVDVVLPGTGISWKNDDNSTLTVKASGDSEGMFNSGELLPGAQFQYVFGEKVGTYTYALANNKSVNGTIIVKAGRTLTG